MKKAYQMKSESKEQGNAIIQHEKLESVRLNKYISSSGFCSRREADRYIELGKVKIDGKVAELGDRVYDYQQVSVDNHSIETDRKLVYIALHKPVGITCTTDAKIPDNIATFMDYPGMIFPIGRLDKDSSGLILLTNDGDIVNKILRSTNHHEKQYIVTVDKEVTAHFMEQLANGIKIYNPVNNTYQMTKPAIVSKISSKTFSIILTQGLNRQIRRMCTALDSKVQSLKRVRVMNIELGNLKIGQWRYISDDELRILNDAIQKKL